MNEVPVTVTPPRQHPLALGFAAARANALPAVLLWLFGTAVVAAYYLWPAARPAFDTVAGWKGSLGLWYAAIFTAFFAGLIPYLMQALQRGGAKRWSPVYLGYMLLFWAIKGVEFDLLYRGQAWLFGEGRDVGTLVTKTCIDQFVYVSLWAGPTMVLGMLLAYGGFSLRRLRHHLRPGWYRRLVLPVVIPNWLVWVPAVMLIYMLPTVLQLPVQNVVMCMWVLMVMFMTGEQHNAEPEG
ncbi:MAG: hypothetical protein WD534_17485 [Phycisphaeraceae bacterium]